MNKKIVLSIIGVCIVGIVGCGIGMTVLTSNNDNNISNSDNLNNNVNNNIQNDSVKSKIKLKNNAKPVDIQMEQYAMDIDLNWMGNFLSPLDLNNGSYESQVKDFLTKLPGSWEDSLSAGNYEGEDVFSQEYKLVGDSWITIDILANGVNNTVDNRVVLSLDMYESLDGVEKDLEKMLQLGNIMLGTNLYEYDEIMEGINNLNSKEVRVSLDIKDNDDSTVFGSVFLRSGKKFTGSETAVKMSIQIGTYYK